MIKKAAYFSDFHFRLVLLIKIYTFDSNSDKKILFSSYYYSYSYLREKETKGYIKGKVIQSKSFHSVSFHSM